MICGSGAGCVVSTLCKSVPSRSRAQCRRSARLRQSAEGQWRGRRTGCSAVPWAVAGWAGGVTRRCARLPDAAGPQGVAEARSGPGSGADRRPAVGRDCRRVIGSISQLCWCRETSPRSPTRRPWTASGTMRGHEGGDGRAAPLADRDGVRRDREDRRRVTRAWRRPRGPSKTDIWRAVAGPRVGVDRQHYRHEPRP